MSPPGSGGSCGAGSARPYPTRRCGVRSSNCSWSSTTGPDRDSWRVLPSRVYTLCLVELQKLRHDRSELVTRAIQPALWLPLFFASNALYPDAIMPDWLKVLGHVNPLSYEV